MRIFITLFALMALSVTTLAQNENVPEWQRLTKQELKALQRAEKEQQYHERMRAKALNEAKDKQKAEKEQENKPVFADSHWFAGIDVGSGMAFGDDSWNVFREFSPASGFNMSGYVGYHFNKMIGARLRMRHLKQYSRVNLETYFAYKDRPATSQYFPRQGFYGYNTFAAEGEFMLNLSKLFSPTHHSPCNVYMLVGTGVNNFYSYDKNVENWKQEAGKLDGGWYNVDSKSHSQWLGMGGLLVDYRLSKHLSVNFDLSGTGTTDNMEGVVSEEWYDVYITWGLGLTYHF